MLWNSRQSLKCNPLWNQKAAYILLTHNDRGINITIPKARKGGTVKKKIQDQSKTVTLLKTQCLCGLAQRQGWTRVRVFPLQSVEHFCTTFNPPSSLPPKHPHARSITPSGDVNTTAFSAVYRGCGSSQRHSTLSGKKTQGSTASVGTVSKVGYRVIKRHIGIIFTRGKWDWISILLFNYIMVWSLLYYWNSSCPTVLTYKTVARVSGSFLELLRGMKKNANT